MNEQIGQALKSFRPPPFKSKHRLSLSGLVYIDQKDVNIESQHAVKHTTTGHTPPEAEHNGDQTPMKNHPKLTIPHATATHGRHGCSGREEIKKKAIAC